MDESWGADFEIEPTDDGRFRAVLVLTPPAEVRPPIRTVIPGEYDSAIAAEYAAVDAFAAMTRGGVTVAVHQIASADSLTASSGRTSATPFTM